MAFRGGVGWRRPGINPRQTRGLFNYRPMPTGFDPDTGQRPPWHGQWPEGVPRPRGPQVGGAREAAAFASSAPAYDVEPMRQAPAMMASSAVPSSAFPAMEEEELPPYDVLYPELETRFGRLSDA